MAFLNGSKGKPGGGGQLDGYLGPGTVVEGTVRFAEVLRVDGKITGKVFSEKELIVGEEGKVEADVEVGTLSVAGQVSGKIVIKDRMEIHPGARVSGEIRMKQPRLQVHDGGIFEGTIHMGAYAAEGRAAEPRPEAGKVQRIS